MKKLSVFLAITVLFLIMTPVSSIFAAGEIELQYKCGETNTSTNAIKPYLNVKNITSETIELNDLKICYWYTNEDSAVMQSTCDYAVVGTNNITSTVNDEYIEIGFLEGAGNLASGASTGMIQLRFNRSDWQTLDQSNDYSFDASYSDFGINNKITVYLNDELVFGIEPNGNAAPTPTPTPTLPGNDDWLHTDGNKIVDADGNPVWLTGTNWFGFNTGTNCFDGIWSCSMRDAISEMADRGINLLRVPISTELIYEWSQGIYPTANFSTSANPELVGLNSYEIFDKAVEYCKEFGMKIMIDVHGAKTDAFGHFHPLWYNGEITTEIFYEAWEWMADQYKDDDTIIAFDLENEPHGKAYEDLENSAIWDDSESINNWKNAAEECAERILAINPNLLIMIEGIETYPKPGKDYTSTDEDDYYGNWWGGNLRGVADYPVDLGVNQDQIVYSPHDYGPSVHKQEWFYDGFDKNTLYNDVWKDNWAYIMEDDIAPLLMGEWGGFLDGGENQAWMTAIRDYMIEEHIHHTFWCFNANSGDTGGLVEHDFTTWDEDKYNFIKSSLWQDSNENFVGLDHQRVLGTNGTNVTEYYQNGEPAPVPSN